MTADLFKDAGGRWWTLVDGRNGTEISAAIGPPITKCGRIGGFWLVNRENDLVSVHEHRRASMSIYQLP